ncbi:MAG: metallophosphoesterase family protein [Methanosarcinaceae archaeon]|nr:metallophosphoesterase family protein [Methanosarcinaceae archaeon]
MKLLIISDIHGNKEALDAVLEVEHDAIVCLGDLVDYGPAPAECIDLIRRSGVRTIMGNHDNAVAFKVDCECGDTYKHLSIATREYTWEQLDDSHIEYLKGLRADMNITFKDAIVHFAHGSPRSMYEYIQPKTPNNEILEMIQNMHADVIVVGHSHIPFVRDVGGVKIVNPGSVGQSRDGDARASCAVFDTETQAVDIIRCEYDIDSVCTQIRESMPHADELIQILERGH